MWCLIYSALSAGFLCRDSLVIFFLGLGVVFFFFLFSFFQRVFLSLLSLEFLVLTIMVSLNCLNPVGDFYVSFLVMAVCAASVGISVLVKLSRSDRGGAGILS